MAEKKQAAAKIQQFKVRQTLSHRDDDSPALKADRLDLRREWGFLTVLRRLKQLCDHMAERGLGNRQSPSFPAVGVRRTYPPRVSNVPSSWSEMSFPIDVKQGVGFELIADQLHPDVFQCGLYLFNCRRTPDRN